MEQKKTIETLVDEMIGFSVKAGGSIDGYVEICEQSVESALDGLDGSIDMETIYSDAQEFLRIAKLRQEESNNN